MFILSNLILFIANRRILTLILGLMPLWMNPFPCNRKEYGKQDMNSGTEHRLHVNIV
jgi:hypothetical protein